MTGTRAFFLLAATLSGCAHTYIEEPYTGPVPPPQVVYRIDEARYFEAVPYYRYSCTAAKLVYVDAARGIRSVVAGWDNVVDSEYIVDAASGRYLVSPIISPNCESGGGLCGDRILYSEDYGNTWHKGMPRFVGGRISVVLVDDNVYVSGHRARVSDLGNGYAAWDVNYPGTGNAIPPASRPPIDTRFHCTKSESE